MILKKSLHLTGCRVIAVWLEKQCQIRKKDLPLQNICVVANLISDETKRKYEEAKLGYVWDIRNVLWLFEDYPELKNELISILNYSVGKHRTGETGAFYF